MSLDVVIIGAGPAGLSAAQMLGRARRDVLVVDAGVPRNRFAARMHGVLGHDGRSPRELHDLGVAEAQAYGVAFADGEALSTERLPDGIRVTFADGTTHEARTLIAATGLRDDLPDVPGLAERWGRTVLHCPYCHGWEVRGRRLGVLATSPMAAHQAQLITQWSDDVVFFTHGLGGSLDPAVEARLRARGVRLVPDEVVAVDGAAPEISGVRLASGEQVAVDAIFTGGTLAPLDGWLDGLALDRAETPVGSFVAADPVTSRTSDPRVWAVGNVGSPMANVPLAIGAGAMAGAHANMALVELDLDAAVAAAG